MKTLAWVFWALLLVGVKLLPDVLVWDAPVQHYKKYPPYGIILILSLRVNCELLKKAELYSLLHKNNTIKVYMPDRSLK